MQLRRLQNTAAVISVAKIEGRDHVIDVVVITCDQIIVALSLTIAKIQIVLIAKVHRLLANVTIIGA